MTTTTTGHLTLRTSQEIAQSRKAASAFFHGLATASTTRIEKIRAEGARSPNLHLLLFNVSQWQNPATASREAARKRWERVEENLKPYVGRETARRMPAHRFLSPEPGNTAALRKERKAWAARMHRPSPRLISRPTREQNAHYRLWILENERLSTPVLAGGLSVARSTEKAPLTTRYIPGKVNPAGMTPERALEIAMAALEHLYPAGRGGQGGPP
ncbi:hypothetical protein IWX78_003094 [Mycetocola sp. CAN_C7]|uniref:hypothetical protein n=1 Tax=Mycetocola sp. CAN_C7 TaxID=2787724 RepID=UPI0018C99C1D